MIVESFSGLHNCDLEPEGEWRRSSDGRLSSSDQGEDVAAGVEHHLQDEPGQGALPEPHHEPIPDYPWKRRGELISFSWLTFSENTVQKNC